MDKFVTFGIVGLSIAAIYAVIGSGLVLTYTTTGVFNFAHGAAGMMAAFSYWQLSVGWDVPIPIALAIVLLVLAPLFALIVEVALRPVQGLGDAEKLVMTIALLSGLIALARWIWNPNKSRSIPTFFPGEQAFRIGSATVSWHQAITMLVAVLVALGLRLLLFRTRTGAEMRATVDDRGLVGLTGADPVRANRVAWILGTELAAIGGILIASSVTLDAVQLSLLIVSAYAAAIFGRLRSLMWTFVGAIVVGCLESYLTGYLPQNSYLPGVRLAAPALLLFVALLLFPHGRLRGRERRLTKVPLPSIRGTIALGGVIIAFGVVLATVLSDSDIITYGLIFPMGIIALSFVPLAGYAGQISLCQLSMAGIGAIACARVGAEGQWWALIVAMVVAAVAGAVVALPALRLSGVYLALGTAAFAVILDRWIFTIPSFEVFGVRITIFDQGSVNLVGPRLFGLDLDTTAEITVFAAVCLAIATLAVALVRRSRFGRELIALRDSEAAFATLGGNLLSRKVMVFALAAAIAGLGGALYGMQLRSVSADQFNFVAGLPIFLIAVIAGLGAVGNGLFTGTVIAGPLVALVAVWPASSDIVAVIPAVAGIAFAGGVIQEGAIATIRERWNPFLADRIVLPVTLGLIALLWVLRLVDVIDGYALFAGVIIVIVAAPYVTQFRHRKPPDDTSPVDVPVESWGLDRPWTPEDREVLTDAVIARS